MQATTTSGKNSVYTMDELRAAEWAAYPVDRVKKTLRSMPRRIDMAGGDLEEALQNDKFWGNPSNELKIAERMFCCFYVLISDKYEVDQWAVRSLIMILANRFAWVHFPGMKHMIVN